MLDRDGALYEPFGNGGTKVFSGPAYNDLIPVGALPEKPTGPIARWIWVGAALGNGCADGGQVDCDFALARVKISTGDLHPDGWHVPDEPDPFVESARPHDMALDGAGQPVLAGTVWAFGSNRLAAVVRFQKDGILDSSFGLSGWVVHWFQGHEGDATAVEPLVSGSIAVAIRSVENVGGGDIFSIAMMQILAVGAIEWEHSAWAAGSRYAHHDVRPGLD